MAQDKTVETRFIDGDPEGIRVIQSAFIRPTVVYMPRRLLSRAKQINLPTRGVYYLIGHGTSGIEKIYVGQTRQGVERLTDHNANKDWWDVAVLFLSDNKRMFSLDILSALEKNGIDAAVSAFGDRVQNKVDPRYDIQPEDKPVVGMLHDEIEFVMAALGFALDGGPVKAKNLNTNHGYTDVSLASADAGGYRNPPTNVTPSNPISGRKRKKACQVPNGSYVLEREDLELPVIMEAHDGVLTIARGQRVCTREGSGLTKPVIRERKRCVDAGGFVHTDAVFRAPSPAASFVSGTSLDGWEYWKTVEPVDGEIRDLDYFRKKNG